MTERATPLWTARARAAMAAGLAVGAALVVVGAAGAGSEESLQDEIAWLNVAVAGLILGGATAILWLLAGRRAVTAAREAVVVRYASDLELPTRAVDPRVRLTERVTVAGSSWSHRPDCLLTAGKPLLEARPAEALAPCPVCGG